VLNESLGHEGVAQGSRRPRSPSHRVQKKKCRTSSTTSDYLTLGSCESLLLAPLPLSGAILYNSARHTMRVSQQQEKRLRRRQHERPSSNRSRPIAVASHE